MIFDCTCNTLLDKVKCVALYKRCIHNNYVLNKSSFPTKYPPIYTRNMFTFRSSSSPQPRDTQEQNDRIPARLEPANRTNKTRLTLTKHRNYCKTVPPPKTPNNGVLRFLPSSSAGSVHLTSQVMSTQHIKPGSHFTSPFKQVPLNVPLQSGVGFKSGHSFFLFSSRVKRNRLTRHSYVHLLYTSCTLLLLLSPMLLLYVSLLIHVLLTR